MVPLAGAGSLHSMIWKYRTRTGPFELDESRYDSTRPEIMLCTMLNEWRDGLLAGAGLETTNLERKYPPHVYAHFQDQGTPSSASSTEGNPIDECVAPSRLLLCHP